MNQKIEEEEKEQVPADEVDNVRWDLLESACSASFNNFKLDAPKLQ